MYFKLPYAVIQYTAQTEQRQLEEKNSTQITVHYLHIPLVHVYM